jgi:hypothetical protein
MRTSQHNVSQYLLNRHNGKTGTKREGTLYWNKKGAEKALEVLTSSLNDSDIFNLKQDVHKANKGIKESPQFKRWKDAVALNRFLEPRTEVEQLPLWDATWRSPVQLMRLYVTDYFDMLKQFKPEVKDASLQNTYECLDATILSGKGRESDDDVTYNLLITDEFHTPSVRYNPKGYDLLNASKEKTPPVGLIHHDWLPYQNWDEFTLLQQAMVRPSHKVTEPSKQYEPTQSMEWYIQKRLKADGFKQRTHYKIDADNPFLEENPFNI